jgi:hypothetical protein
MRYSLFVLWRSCSDLLPHLCQCIFFNDRVSRPLFSNPLQFDRLGDTPFELVSVEVDLPGGATLLR